MGDKMMKKSLGSVMFKMFLVVGILFVMNGNVFAWGLPPIGGGASVDVKGLTGKADKLINMVTDANEKLGLGLADVLTMTGKNDEAKTLREAITALQADRKNGNKAFFMKLETSSAALNKISIRKELERIGKSIASSTAVGSAVLNIKDAVDSDTAAVKEAKSLSVDLSSGVKSAATNPALATSLGDMKSALEAVTLIVDSLPKQIDYATTILKELYGFAQENGISLK